MSASLLLLLLAVSVALRASPARGEAAPLLTFEDRDPITGAPVRCDRCPPGTYMRRRCSSTQGSVCAPCPEGSFTEMWNHIDHCLRCRSCGSRQVETAACTAASDCRCECEPGFYFKQEYGRCARHSACPSGHGVVTAGTPLQDTVCRRCANRTFSDADSAQQGCRRRQNCSAGGTREVLQGSAWHDSVCAECRQRRDGAVYLKEILPAFFVHLQMTVRQMRRVVNRLPTDGGRKQPGVSDPDASEPLRRITAWAESASASQIRQLPATLRKAGANMAAERLQGKLRLIDGALEDCGPGNRLDADFMSETRSERPGRCRPH